MKNKIKVIIVTVLCIFTLACGNSGKSGKVVFESEDKKIKVYESEVNYELEKNLMGTDIKDVPKEELEQMKKNIIYTIALTRSVALEAKKEKLDKSKKYTQGIENVKESLLASVAILEKASLADVSDDEAKQAYEANKQSFERPEDTVSLQLIILDAADKTKAEAVLKEATAKDADFTKIAEKNTIIKENPTGKTGAIPVSQLEKDYAAINEAVKNAQPGQVINSVLTVGNESYIVKVLEKNPKGFIPFDTVKARIKEQLKAQKREQKSQEYIQEVTKKYKLDKINENK